MSCHQSVEDIYHQISGSTKVWFSVIFTVISGNGAILHLNLRHLFTFGLSDLNSGVSGSRVLDRESRTGPAMG